MSYTHTHTHHITEDLGFFFMARFWAYSGPGTQLTTAGMPPGHLSVALTGLNSKGQAAR